MATDINLNQLIINKLTQAQYKEAKEAGQTVDTELYMMTDGGENFDYRYAPLYTYGTEDLVAGVSPLETGKVYFVYEAIDGGGTNTPSEPTLITFYYKGSYTDHLGNEDYVELTLQAEEGMTWAEWVDSSYNTSEDRIYVNGDEVMCEYRLSAGYNMDLNVYYDYSMNEEDKVHVSDVIISGYYYSSPPTSE